MSLATEPPTYERSRIKAVKVRQVLALFLAGTQQTVDLSFDETLGRATHRCLFCPQAI